MAAASGPGCARVLQRMGYTVLLFCGLHVAVWAAAYPIARSMTSSFWSFMGFVLILLGTLGAVTMLLAVCAGLAHTDMEVGKFRTWLGCAMAALTVPLWITPLAPVGTIQSVVAVLYALLMPAPLIPENWEGRPRSLAVSEGRP